MEQPQFLVSLVGRVLERDGKRWLVVRIEESGCVEVKQLGKDLVTRVSQQTFRKWLQGAEEVDPI